MQRTFDGIIGMNIRYQRRRFGLSQKQLAQYLGVSFQQVQKYERGVNQLSAFKLRQLARMFNCTMDRLCESVPDDRCLSLNESLENTFHFDSLLMDYRNIRNSHIRRKIRALVKDLAHQCTT